MLGKTFGRSTGTGTVDLFYLLTLTILLPLQVESGKPLVKVEGEEPQGSGEQGEACRQNANYEAIRAKLAELEERLNLHLEQVNGQDPHQGASRRGSHRREGPHCKVGLTRIAG